MYLDNYTLKVPFAVDLDDSLRVGIQTSFSAFNIVETIMPFLEADDPTVVEVAFGYITRACFSNPGK